MLAAFVAWAADAPRLVDAVKSGDKATILALLDSHADVNAAEADGSTALHWAARLDDLDLAERLLRAGAHVNAANRYGITPLYVACVNGNREMIEKMLQAGADANATWTEGETPLLTMARGGNVEAAKALLAHGAHLSGTDVQRVETVVQLAVRLRETIQRVSDAIESNTRVGRTS